METINDSSGEFFLWRLHVFDIKGKKNSFSNCSIHIYILYNITFCRINNIRHSPSDPALNRPNTAQSRSTSLNRNFTNSASLSARNTATTGTSTSKKNNKLQVHPTPKVDTVTQLRSPVDEIEKEELVPISADKPFGLDVETFLPVSFITFIFYRSSI